MDEKTQLSIFFHIISSIFCQSILSNALFFFIQCQSKSQQYNFIGNSQIFKYSKLHIQESLQQQTYLMEQTIEVLKEYEATSYASLEEKDIVLIEKRPGMAEPQERKRNFIQGTISNIVTEEKYNAIMSKLEEIGVEADISQALPSGGPFGDYGQIDNVFDEGKTHLHHQPGEVLLVDVWATWCGPCQRPMQHNQEMLVKNEATWAGKVRITAVSVDEAKQVVITRVNTKGWNKIQHLTLLGWKGDHQLIKDFSISGIPFVCLVDKFGKINFTGHPSTINLEQRINELIAQDKEAEPESASAAAPSQAEDLKANDKLATLISLENIKNKFQNSEMICLRGNVDTVYEKGITTRKAALEIFAYENEPETLQIIKDTFQGLPSVEVKINTVKTQEVPLQENPTCWECHAALTFPYYWLRWEEGTHFACTNCVEKTSTAEGHHFVYEKNSVLLIGKWARIPVKGFGGNLQPEDVTKVEDGHMFGCNGCGGSSGLGQARYICLGCRADPNFRGDYVDFCEGCKQLAMKKDQALLVQLKNENHTPEHPLLRVLYSTKGYYEF